MGMRRLGHVPSGFSPGGGNPEHERRRTVMDMTHLRPAATWIASHLVLGSLLLGNAAAHAGSARPTPPGTEASRQAFDLRAAGEDLDYRVTFEPERFAFLTDSGSGEFSTSPEEVEREARAANYEFRRLETLPGNVGYLKLDTFSWQLHAAEKAHAAMAFLADCEAVIVDLRDNGGGHSEMVQLLVSYFFPAEPALHLSTFHYCQEESEEAWTLTELPGRRITEAPVFVLTSDSTFSAAEALAYQLSVRGRATIVGQRSSGGSLVEVRDGELRCRPPGEDWMGLFALSRDTFMIEGELDFMITFEKGVDGACDRLYLVYRDGRQRFFTRR